MPMAGANFREGATPEILLPRIPRMRTSALGGSPKSAKTKKGPQAAALRRMGRSRANVGGSCIKDARHGYSFAPTPDKAAHLPLPWAAARPFRGAGRPPAALARPRRPRDRAGLRGTRLGTGARLGGAFRGPVLPWGGGRGLPVRPDLSRAPRARVPARGAPGRRAGVRRREGARRAGLFLRRHRAPQLPCRVVLGPGGGRLGLQRSFLLERPRRALSEAVFARGGRAVLRANDPLWIPPCIGPARGERRGRRREHRLERPEDPAGEEPGLSRRGARPRVVGPLPDPAGGRARRSGPGSEGRATRKPAQHRGRPAHPPGARGVRPGEVLGGGRGGLRRRTASAAVAKALRSDPRRTYSPECVEGEFSEVHLQDLE